MTRTTFLPFLPLLALTLILPVVPVSGSASSSAGGEATFLLRPDPADRGAVRKRIPAALEVEAGDKLLLTFRIRAVAATGEADRDAGQGGLLVRFGEPDPEDQRALSRVETLSIALASGDWQDFRIAFASRGAYTREQAVIEFEPSYFEQTVEVANAQLEKLPAGTDLTAALRSGVSYRGQEPDAEWRKVAADRIRQHRMDDLRIEVRDVFGNPIEGASVEFAMQRHAYPFGTCVVASRIVDAPLHERRENFDQALFVEENRIYRDKLRRLFNFAVFENDTKWPQWVGERPHASDQVWTLEALDWLKSHDFLTKGHTFVWASWGRNPPFLKAFADDPAGLQKAILNHIADLGSATRGQLEFFDVLNEPMSHRDFIEIVGPDGVAEWFHEARRVMPNTKLIVNEFDIVGNGGAPRRTERFIAFVEDLLARGAPIDIIGFQGHFWSPRLTAPEDIWRIIDQFAHLGLPLKISEFDMNIRDEQLQADYTRDFLTAWFSHPATEAFMMWGFWSKAHWMQEAGAMYRDDWSPKPNAHAYENLVLGDWWTNEAVTTGENGEASVRAFLGDYRIDVSAPGFLSAQRPWKHQRDGNVLTIVLPPQQSSGSPTP